MHAIAADPKVLSIVAKSRSEKGYRFHQGPRLRLLLTSLRQTMVSSSIVTIGGGRSVEMGGISREVWGNRRPAVALESTDRVEPWWGFEEAPRPRS